jgi:hypothetical protein
MIQRFRPGKLDMLDEHRTNAGKLYLGGVSSPGWPAAPPRESWEVPHCGHSYPYGMIAQ